MSNKYLTRFCKGTQDAYTHTQTHCASSYTLATATVARAAERTEIIVWEKIYFYKIMNSRLKFQRWFSIHVRAFSCTIHLGLRKRCWLAPNTESVSAISCPVILVKSDNSFTAGDHGFSRDPGGIREGSARWGRPVGHPKQGHYSKQVRVPVIFA